jgi:hypothetical protein
MRITSYLKLLSKTLNNKIIYFNRPIGHWLRLPLFFEKQVRLGLSRRREFPKARLIGKALFCSDRSTLYCAPWSISRSISRYILPHSLSNWSQGRVLSIRNSEECLGLLHSIYGIDMGVSKRTLSGVKMLSKKFPPMWWPPAKVAARNFDWDYSSQCHPKNRTSVSRMTGWLPIMIYSSAPKNHFDGVVCCWKLEMLGSKSVLCLETVTGF